MRYRRHLQRRRWRADERRGGYGRDGGPNGPRQQDAAHSQYRRPVAETIRSPDVVRRPETVISVFTGTSVTVNPAALVSTLIVPVLSRSMNQQPATGHFS